MASSWRKRVVPRHPLLRELLAFDAELARTFNCGIGMMAVVDRDRADEATRLLEAAGETVYRIGHVGRRHGDEPGAVIRNMAEAWAG